LHFRIYGLWLGEFGTLDIDIRLVHQSGKPGLVIFMMDNKPDHPFSNWPECGRENAQPFTTLFFEDVVKTPHTIQSSKTSALVVIEKSLQVIEETLRSDERLQVSKLIQTPEIEFWLLVMLQINSCFQRFEKNLHYDDVRCKPLSDVGIKFTLINPSYAGRLLDRFAIIWPAARKTSPSLEVIKILNGKGKMPIFESWPTDANGFLNRQWTIELGSLNTEIIPKIPFSDAQLLKRLIQEIPNFLHHYNIQNPDQKCDDTLLVHLVHKTYSKCDSKSRNIIFNPFMLSYKIFFFIYVG
jgi:hypothetical protein